MRFFIALLFAFSLCVCQGCGSKSGPRNVTQADMSKAGGNLPTDEAPPTPTARSTPSKSQADATKSDSKSSPTAAAASRFAEEGPPESSSSPAAGAATTKTQPKQQTAPTAAAASRFAEEGPPEDSSSPAAGAGTTKTQPKQQTAPTAAAASRFAEEGPPTGLSEGAAEASPPSALIGRGKGVSGKGAALTGSTETTPTSEAAGGNRINTATLSEVVPVTLLDKAASSFKEFKGFDAEQYLYAYWLTDEGAIGDYPLQWVSGISEPRIFLRWGIGVAYVAPVDFSARPPVIGDPVAAPTAPANRSGRPGGRTSPLNESASTNAGPSPYANVDRSTPTGNMLYYTGDFGDRLVKRLNSRRKHQDYFYGKILAMSQLSDMEADRNRSVTATITTPGVSEPQHAILLGGLDEGSSETVTTNTVARGGTNTSGVTATTGTIIPGVIFLGVENGSTAEQGFIEQAKSMGLDGLLVFHVTIKEKSRSGAAFSTTSLAVHNVKTGESPPKTSSLSSETVAKARQKDSDSDNDPVERALDKIFKDYSDEKLRVSEMPDLKPDVVKKRVDSLVAETHENPLPVVAEIVSYHKKGLLDEAAALAAMSTLLGNEDAAKTLLTGSSEEKIAAIEKWMPGNFDLPESGASFR